MDLNEHSKESIDLYGIPYEEIHKYLDEFSGKPEIEMKHLKFWSHEAGMRQAIELFGVQSEKFARKHMISD